MKNNVMNLVNFVRGCEPRKKNWDLYTPVVDEIKINKEAGLPSTFLLQYDAMIRPDLREVFLRERGEDLETGVWLEMGKPLTEACGIAWRGRPGFDWDWYVNPGFLLAYTQEQRKSLIDEVFRLYREIFGEYPRVVGSWLLDAYSLSYMSNTYGIDAFVICREQYAVDAYTLWGGYYNGGYYPSRNNAICPAQNKDLQIDTPVFRMLGIDPIYGYDEEKQAPKLGGCYTMEPFWPSGANEEVMDWYFRSYYGNPSLALSHATTGQENSFDWTKVEAGYRMQIKLLKKYIAEGLVRCETLGKTGRDFKEMFESTPASALSALEDWSGNDIQSVWYSCKSYRANLFRKGQALLFRDIHTFDDALCEDHLTEPCTAWQAFYETNPVVDNRMQSEGEKLSELRFCKDVAEIASPTEQGADALELTVRFADGQTGKVLMNESGITLLNCGNLSLAFGKGEIYQGRNGNVLSFRFRENNYQITLDAELSEQNGSLCLAPRNGKQFIKLS